MAKIARTEETPFQAASLTGQAFEMAKAGVDISDLVFFISQRGGSPARILRILRKGVTRDLRWDIVEKDGRLKVTYPAKKA